MSRRDRSGGRPFLVGHPPGLHGRTGGRHVAHELGRHFPGHPAARRAYRRPCSAGPRRYINAAAPGMRRGWRSPRSRSRSRHWPCLAPSSPCLPTGSAAVPSPSRSSRSRGGYAMSGRGPVSARMECGVLATLFVVALVAAGPFVGGPRPGLTSPRGAWVAVLIGSLQTTLALAASAPFRAGQRRA